MRKKLLFILFSLMIIAGAAFFARYQIKKSIHHLAKAESNAFFNEIVIMRAWNSMHGGVYVPVSPISPPNPYLEDSLRDLTTTNGLQLTMINPAYMTRQISEISNEKRKITYHITSLKPIRPANKADQWERKALISFENGQREAFGTTQYRGKKQFRYMAPLVVEESCLKCHAKQGYKIGEIRGGISVSKPYRFYENIISKQTTWIYILASSLFLFFSTFTIIIFRKF